MLQKSTLFLHTAEEEKNYNEEPDFSFPKALSPFTSPIIVSTGILISILGLIANGIIFWLLCCTIKKTKFTIYVVNLVVSDFFILLHSLEFLIAWLIPDLINNRIFQAFLMMLFFGYETNSYFLAAMSIERCLIVFSPAWYQSHRQKQSTVLVCTFIWILSVSLKMLDFFLCERGYTVGLPAYNVPCKVTVAFRIILLFGIAFLAMIFSNLALCIRMKIKPEDDFPARLDFSIWATVILHLIIVPFIEGFQWIILFNPPLNYHLEYFYVTVICYPVASSVNPFVYLVVGYWKWEKGQQPFYMFLERALKDDDKSSMRTQPEQEHV